MRDVEIPNMSNSVGDHVWDGLLRLKMTGRGYMMRRGENMGNGFEAHRVQWFNRTQICNDCDAVVPACHVHIAYTRVGEMDVFLRRCVLCHQMAYAGTNDN